MRTVNFTKIITAIGLAFFTFFIFGGKTKLKLPIFVFIFLSCLALWAYFNFIDQNTWVAVSKAKELDKTEKVQNDVFDWIVTNGKAEWYAMTGNREKAKYYFKEAINLRSSRDISYFRLAVLYRQEKEYDKALNVYHALKELAPNTIFLNSAIEQTLKEKKNSEASKKGQLSSETLSPNNHIPANMQPNSVNGNFLVENGSDEKSLEQRSKKHGLWESVWVRYTGWILLSAFGATSLGMILNKRSGSWIFFTGIVSIAFYGIFSSWQKNISIIPPVLCLIFIFLFGGAGQRANQKFIDEDAEKRRNPGNDI